VLYSNGTLILTPIKVDGRQIYSEPCKYKMSIYTRYNQTETYKVGIHLVYRAVPAVEVANGYPPHPPTVVRNSYGRTSRKETTQPLPVRRRANEPHVPGVQPATNATYFDSEPSLDGDRGRKSKSNFRKEDQTQAGTAWRLQECRRYQHRPCVVARSRIDESWARWVSLRLGNATAVCRVVG